MDYEIGPDGLSWQRPLGDNLRLGIVATNLRQERTGTHARIEIQVNGRTIAWTTMNIERDEDRVRLSNAAYGNLAGRLNGHAEIFDRPEMKRSLDAFCQGVWGASLGAMASIMVAGAEAVPPQYVLDPYIIAGGGTILFAKPGRGKSFLLMLWAVSIDAGDEIPPAYRLWGVARQPVLFINLERDAGGVARRLGRVNTVLGLPYDRPLRMMNQRGRSLADIAPVARREVREHGIRHVCLDSISRAGAGDLNENLAANRIIDMLNGLAPSWSGIAHAPRASDEHVFGGIHFDAGADVIVRVQAEEQGELLLGAGLQIIKANDLPKRPAEVLALEFADYGLKRVRRSSVAEFPGLRPDGDAESLSDMVYAHLRAFGQGASATEISRELGLDRLKVSKELQNEALYRVYGKKGASVLYGVVTRYS